MPTTPAEIRKHLIDALQLDLVGPTPDDTAHAEEILPQAPSKWYLCGFLVPYEASPDKRSDDTGNEELDQHSNISAGDDETNPETASARKAFSPLRWAKLPRSPGNRSDRCYRAVGRLRSPDQRRRSRKSRN